MRPERKLVGLLVKVLLGLSDNCRNHVHLLAVQYQQQPHANIYELQPVGLRLKVANTVNEDLTETLTHWNKLSDKLEKGDRKVLGKLLEVTAEVSGRLAQSAVFILRQKGKKGRPIHAPSLAAGNNGLIEVLLPSRLDRSIKTLIDDTNALIPNLQRRSQKPRAGSSSDFARIISEYKKRGMGYQKIAEALHKSGRFSDYPWLEDHKCKTWLDVLKKPAHKKRRSFQQYIAHFPKV